MTLSGKGVTEGMKDLTMEEKCKVKSMRFLDQLVSKKEVRPAVGQYNLKDRVFNLIHTGVKCKRQ